MGEQPRRRRPPHHRSQWNGAWPGGKLNYPLLERLKEPIARLAHPTRQQQLEWRLSVLPWSRAAYVDLRLYWATGKPTRRGVLLHQDLLVALLPTLTALVRRLELDDGREPHQKAHVEVVPA